MFGDLKEYWKTLKNGDRTQNGPQGRPRQRWADRINDNLRIIGVENAKEV